MLESHDASFFTPRPRMTVTSFALFFPFPRIHFWYEGQMTKWTCSSYRRKLDGACKMLKPEKSEFVLLFVKSTARQIDFIQDLNSYCNEKTSGVTYDQLSSGESHNLSFLSDSCDTCAISSWRDGRAALVQYKALTRGLRDYVAWIIVWHYWAGERRPLCCHYANYCEGMGLSCFLLILRFEVSLATECLFCP